MRPKKVYVLYGVAERDRSLVCMFFRTLKDRKEFKKALPGRYDQLTLVGVGYNDFDISFKGCK